MTSIIYLMIFAMHFGFLVLKLLTHAKNIVSRSQKCYIMWRDMGKPKHGPLCELMQKTRLYFKYIKQCEQREDMARADAMAKSMHTKDTVTFWKNIYKLYLYMKVIPKTSSVNGADNSSSISAMWKTHFESLLNNVTADENMQNVKECVNNTGNLCNDNDIHITSCMVQDAIHTDRRILYGAMTYT